MQVIPNASLKKPVMYAQFRVVLQAVLKELQVNPPINILVSAIYWLQQ